jgi:hypothetical protein
MSLKHASDLDGHFHRLFPRRRFLLRPGRKSCKALATHCLQPYEERRCLRLEGGREVPEEHVGVEELVDGEEAGMARHVGQLGQHDPGRLLRLLRIF